MDDKERDTLRSAIERRYRWYDHGSRVWSALHHWSLALSAILSALSALVLKLDSLARLLPALDAYRNDLAAGLAGLGAVIATVAASGGFGRKWQTNRISRGQVERLLLDVEAPDAIGANVRDMLKEVIKTHDEHIVGAPLKDR